MTSQVIKLNRRAALALGAAAAAVSLVARAKENTLSTSDQFWPNNARLAVSFSLMFEAGGQPISGAPGSFGPIKKGAPDLATNGLFQYGVYEGIPRILDLMDKHHVKLSSFMIGQAVDKAPDLAREIVRRGHEAAAHGRTWQNSYLLDPDAERRFITDGMESIHKATGQTPVGWNAYYVRNTPHTFDILQSLGFKYHIDEPSADEPFIIKLKGGDFVTVPYTIHMNDIASFTFEGWNPAAYEQALKDEFDQLYEEGAHRRRMMAIGLHDRISGHADRVRVLDRFLTYARSKPGVWFARKDEIAALRLSMNAARRLSPGCLALRLKGLPCKQRSITMTERTNGGRPAAMGFDLTGKRVIVVGGKTGGGLGIAQGAHAAGAAVVLASRRSFSEADHPELADFEQIALDVEDEDAVRGAFKAIGALDHLVVAAGPAMGSWGAFSDTDMRGVRHYTDSKFLGAWACARYASDGIAADGSITFLTGGTAVRSKVGLAAVTSVFSAVEALGRSLALELGPVRVNTLRLGFIDTPFWDFLTEAQATEVRQKVREKFPVGRVGTPADVGHAAVFLMTNPYVTGTVIEVSGGELLVDWVF